MDTQRVAELLKQIEEQEAARDRAHTVLAEAQQALQATENRLQELKQELAAELADLLPRARRPRAASAAPASGGRERQAGIGEAILAVFDDGEPHSVKEVEAALASRGFTPEGVNMRLSVFARGGKLRRTERGVYAKA